ncbi:hypothetical protein P885DRAFT_29857 [Corynascus similis CBS 632.67]
MDACGSEEKPILWSNEVWEGDPGGDVTVDFRGRSWKVRKDIVSNQFPWIKDAIARTKPVSSASKLPYQLWEDSPSFVTYVRLYFVAERLGIGRLQHGMAVCVEGLSRHVAALAVAHRCPHCHPTRAKADQEEEGRHLASFLDAILVVEAHPWSARIVKAMYDAGDHMKARLARLPAFAEFVERSPQGKNFAKAIGAHHL